MHVSEYDLFPGTTYSGDQSQPFVYCLGQFGCGCPVVNSYDARAKHVKFHNREES